MSRALFCCMVACAETCMAQSGEQPYDQCTQTFLFFANTSRNRNLTNRQQKQPTNLSNTLIWPNDASHQGNEGPHNCRAKRSKLADQWIFVQPSHHFDIAGCIKLPVRANRPPKNPNVWHPSDESTNTCDILGA